MARLQSVFAKSAAFCTRATIPCPASSATIVASGGPFLGPNGKIDVSSAWTRIIAPFPQKQPQYRQHDAGPFLAGSRRISAKTVAKQPQRTELRPPRATLLLSLPPAPYRERQEDQHHTDCCPKEERVLRAPWSRVIALGDRCSIKGSQRGPRAK